MHATLRLQVLLFVATSGNVLGQSRLLEGYSFSCCTIAEYPIVIRDTSNRYNFTGLAFDYLMQMEQRLGFKCSSMYEVKGADTSFTRFTEHMKNCTDRPDLTDPLCRCELGVGGWLTTRERVDRVQYLPPFLRLDTDVLTHIDNTAGAANGAFFIHVFPISVWISIGVVYLLFTFVRVMDQWLEPPPKAYEPLPRGAGWVARAKHFIFESRIRHRLERAACHTAMDMLQQPEPVDVTKRHFTRRWVLQFGIVLAGVFLLLVWDAVMTAQLIQEKITAAYRTADDFRMCRIDVGDVCLARGGAEESYWRNSFAHAECADGQMPRFIDSYDRVIEMVAEKKCKFVLAGNAQTGEALYGKHCSSVVKVGDPVFWGGASFVLPLSANRSVVVAMRGVTLDLVEQGKLSTLTEYYKRKGECFQHSNGAIRFSRLRIFFIVVIVFIVVMFVVMIIDPNRPPEDDESAEAELDCTALSDGIHPLQFYPAQQRKLYDGSSMSMDVTDNCDCYRRKNK